MEESFIGSVGWYEVKKDAFIPVRVVGERRRSGRDEYKVQADGGTGAWWITGTYLTLVASESVVKENPAELDFLFAA